MSQFCEKWQWKIYKSCPIRLLSCGLGNCDETFCGHFRMQKWCKCIVVDTHQCKLLHQRGMDYERVWGTLVTHTGALYTLCTYWYTHDIKLFANFGVCFTKFDPQVLGIWQNKQAMLRWFNWLPHVAILLKYLTIPFWFSNLYIIK